MFRFSLKAYALYISTLKYDLIYSVLHTSLKSFSKVLVESYDVKYFRKSLESMNVPIQSDDAFVILNRIKHSSQSKNIHFLVEKTEKKMFSLKIEIFETCVSLWYHVIKLHFLSPGNQNQNLCKYFYFGTKDIATQGFASKHE